MENSRTKLHVWSFGFALGLVWAIGLLIVGWIGALSTWGASFISVMGSIYLGFKPTFWGAVIGAVWGFVDCFIAGVILAAIYNVCKCPCSKSNKNSVSFP